jgi:hypothetical protein
MKRLLFIGLTAVVVVGFLGSASAAPRLQTYIMGSSYYNNYNNMDRYSWISNTSSFDLKVVGYWGPAGGRAPRYDYMDCYLAMSVPRHQSGSIWINGVEITAFSYYHRALPRGLRPSWRLPLSSPSRYSRFNFTDIGRIDNNQIGAYHYDHGRIHQPGWGDEILLNVVVQGFSWSHFDAVGIDSRGRTITGSQYHDSSYYSTPEPGTLSLLGIGLLGLVPVLRKKKKK